jgi:hypothetical protein
VESVRPLAEHPEVEIDFRQRVDAGRAAGHLVGLWGTSSTCGGLAARQRRLTTGAQDAILPRKAAWPQRILGGADFSTSGRDAAVARINNPFRRANEIKEFAGGFLESLRRPSGRLMRG